MFVFYVPFSLCLGTALVCALSPSSHTAGGSLPREPVAPPGLLPAPTPHPQQELFPPLRISFQSVSVPFSYSVSLTQLFLMSNTGTDRYLTVLPLQLGPHACLRARLPDLVPILAPTEGSNIYGAALGELEELGDVD